MFAKNLKYLRTKRGYDQQTFAEMIHRSVSTVSEWESGKYTPKAGILADIANMFGVKLDDMMNKDLSKSADNTVIEKTTNTMRKLHPARQQKVCTYAEKQLDEQQNENVISLDDERQERQPMLLHIAGTVSAGTGEYLPDDDTGDDIPFSGPVPDYDFALRVNGDSMEPMFEDGQIIFVKKCDDCDIHSGQVVIADLNGDAYVKKIDIQPDGVRLVSLNPKYKPILVESFDDFAIQGIVML
ncbi:helix-turn-helix domain-containing protein [Schleiferilactobacillus harbinensis]|uniref:Bifunctional S24 family peptidase transcriptional regulator n=1 Tax=Schleiferilactobacillus harbinensis DSM 16991 TaxID=1122147 RepID=A0A0R1XF81_9LACO|nr:S24 family peptidase [Schleiferilactobacillus harbinensis]KRM25500.1 bifunctional S24 family peptidase transcriptional regulator [Schleiferilactobacillus harbinensis DSM 16991]QFR64533.1 helix-turn-helix domain-containing protein [Schleiferilactobacillus harbinensis]